MELSKRKTQIALMGTLAFLATIGLAFAAPTSSTLHSVVATSGSRSITYNSTTNVDPALNNIHVKTHKTLTFNATTIVGGDSGTRVVTSVNFITGNLIVEGKTDKNSYLICNGDGSDHAHFILSFQIKNLQSFSVVYAYSIANNSSHNTYTLYSDNLCKTALGTTTLDTVKSTSNQTISYTHASGATPVNSFAVNLIDDTYVKGTTSQIFVRSITASWIC
jgi:hypothetical protein